MINSSNKKLLLHICLLLIFCGSTLKGQIIRSQTQNWNQTFSGTDLTTSNEAGEDLNSSVETASNFNMLDIAGLAPGKNWKVTVSKQDINWSSGFIPSIQRTGNGTPCGTCSGVNTGSSVTGYLQVTDAEQNFIFGSGNVSNISLQFRITGLTLAVPAQNYSTRIVFTLYGEP